MKEIILLSILLLFLLGTILYKPPSLGWEAGTEAVMEKEDAFKATM